MSSVSSSKSKKLLLLLILWLLPAQACASATNTPAPPSTSPEYKAIELVNLCDELNDGKLKECDLVVIVKSLTQTLNVNIVAQATAGILFKEYVQGELDTNRRKIVISLSLAPNEERRLILPYEVDETVLFSGEYVIKVDAVESKNSVLFSNRTKAFVRVQAGQKPELLPTQQEFDNHFSNSFHYIYSNIELSTNDKLSVLIQLQDIPEPTEGQVLVKVVSDEDNYNPTIEMQISGGILFEETSLIEVNNSQYVALNSPGIIQATGSRILVFPFHLDTQSVDGTYSIVIISKDETGIVREDISSLGIEKFSSTVKDELAWLTTITFNLLPTPTPLPTPSPYPAIDIIGIVKEAIEISEDIVGIADEIVLEPIEEVDKTILTTQVYANLRNGPNTSYDIILVTKPNEQVTAIGVINPLDVEERWYKVQMSNGTIGWVHSSVIKSIDSTTLSRIPVLRP